MVAAAPSPALGEEQFGNEPVGPNEEWAPGVLAVANDPSRVYRRWINGNEDFCYRGRAAELQRCLSAFAAIEAERRVVRLVPVPGGTLSFERKAVAYDWRLNVPSGLFKGLAMQEGAPLPTAAILTVHVVGDALSPGRVTWPDGVELMAPEGHVSELRTALATSKTQQARSFGIGELAELRYVDGVYEVLRPYLDVEDEWLHLGASRALAQLGKRAEKAEERIAQLAAQSEDTHRREWLEESLIQLRANVAKVEDEAAAKVRTARHAEIRALLAEVAAKAAEDK
jgi:hypothetical protein